jgi:hypothetical protein
MSEFFAFSFESLPESISGASAVTSLSPSQSLDLCDGSTGPETFGKGLASILALLAFGSISYRTNPWSGRTKRNSKALACAFPDMLHLKVKPGQTLKRADFQAWFESVVRLAEGARNKNGNLILAPKKSADRDDVAKKPTNTSVTIPGPKPADLSVGQIIADIRSMSGASLDNAAVTRAEQREAVRLEREAKETREAQALEARLQNQRDDGVKDYGSVRRHQVTQFADLARLLNIKLTKAQLAQLDKVEQTSRLAA